MWPQQRGGAAAAGRRRLGAPSDPTHCSPLPQLAIIVHHASIARTMCRPPYAMSWSLRCAKCLARRTSDPGSVRDDRLRVRLQGLSRIEACFFRRPCGMIATSRLDRCRFGELQSTISTGWASDLCLRFRWRQHSTRQPMLAFVGTGRELDSDML